MPARPLVLVHGAWAASWVWDSILPDLQKAGLEVYAPTLPGQQDGLDPESISLQVYVEFIGEILSGIEQPAVLVGHSGGGMVISQLAEAWPERVDKLVYVGGMMLPSGTNYSEFCVQVLGPGSVVGASRVMKLDASGKNSVLETDELKQIFYNCTPDELAEQAIQKLQPQPLGGLYLLNELSEANFGSVEKHYVRLGLDNTVLPALQDEMVRLTPVRQVHRLQTDHVPQLSMPEQLTDLLTELCLA